MKAGGSGPIDFRRSRQSGKLTKDEKVWNQQYSTEGHSTGMLLGEGEQSFIMQRSTKKLLSEYALKITISNWVISRNFYIKIKIKIKSYRTLKR